MNYILRKKEWSLETIEGIIHKMKNPMAVLHSKEPPLAADMVFRWGCTGNLKGNPTVINSAKAIHRVFDKRNFRMGLNNEKLCPKTWFSLLEFIEDDAKVYPVIVRPEKHEQGIELYICNNLDQLKEAWDKVDRIGYICPCIDKTAEYRYFVANDRIVTVYKKLPKKQGMMLWNDYEEYVSFENWSIPMTKAAIKAHQMSKLHWSAIDIIEDRNKIPYILEINTAPEIQSPYRQECMAKIFDFFIYGVIKEIPLSDKPDNWKKFIHPAISDQAYL